MIILFFCLCWGWAAGQNLLSQNVHKHPLYRVKTGFICFDPILTDSTKDSRFYRKDNTIPWEKTFRLVGKANKILEKELTRYFTFTEAFWDSCPESVREKEVLFASFGVGQVRKVLRNGSVIYDYWDVFSISDESGEVVYAFSEKARKHSVFLHNPASWLKKINRDLKKSWAKLEAHLIRREQKVRQYEESRSGEREEK